LTEGKRERVMEEFRDLREGKIKRRGETRLTAHQTLVAREIV